MSEKAGTAVWGKVLVSVVLGLAMIIAIGRVFVFQYANIPDANMYPTLSANDEVLVSLLATPAAGDVVLVSAGGQLMIRRIVAVGGESVGVKDGGVTIGDKALPRTQGEKRTFMGAVRADNGVAERGCIAYSETLGARTYTTCLGTGSQIRNRNTAPVTVALDEYFVLCDNRLYCGSDSRDVGTVKRHDVVGRVDYIMARAADSEQPWYTRLIGNWEAL